MYYKPFAGFCQFAPLDKPAGMGIIISRRGRCDKRSAPELVNDFNGLYSPQKPSPARVAVFAFQSLDSYRDRMTQNMNRKHEKHTVTPPSKGGNRPPCYVYSVLGMYYKLFAGFCQFAPLDKPVGMGIIVDVRGRCDKRSAPLK